jgi:hypothetical protein
VVEVEVIKLNREFIGLDKIVMHSQVGVFLAFIFLSGRTDVTRSL